MSTCDVFNCLLPLDVQNEIQLAAIKSQEPLLVMASLFIGFLVEEYVACQRFRMASFSFSPCLMRKRIAKSEATLALPDNFQELHLEW